MNLNDLQTSLTDLQVKQTDIAKQLQDLNATQEGLLASYTSVNSAINICKYWVDILMGTTVINDSPNPVDKFNRLVLETAS